MHFGLTCKEGQGYSISELRREAARVSWMIITEYKKNALLQLSAENSDMHGLTEYFATLEPRNPSIQEIYLAGKR